jgi:hypothetical protein
MTLRCTRKLLKRLGAEVTVASPEPTTVLGDWHANLLFTRPDQVVLCVNDRSRLPVLVSAKDASRLLPRISSAVATLLLRIGVPSEAVLRETQQMEAAVIGRARDRSVLGSMNDFAFLFQAQRMGGPDRNLDDWSWELSGTPCGPLRYAYPREEALRMFSAV